MKITFPCTRRGKTLKARQIAVGRTRKCPICATRVTCPEPTYGMIFGGIIGIFRGISGMLQSN